MHPEMLHSAYMLKCLRPELLRMMNFFACCFGPHTEPGLLWSVRLAHADDRGCGSHGRTVHDSSCQTICTLAEDSQNKHWEQLETFWNFRVMIRNWHTGSMRLHIEPKWGTALKSEVLGASADDLQFGRQFVSSSGTIRRLICSRWIS